MPKINSLFEGSGQFRLPTEDEWEYACRAGAKTVYYWGDEIKEGYCWHSSNSEKVMPVGLLKPNAWGLYDMSGNIRELCSDKYGTYRKGIIIDPVGKGCYNSVRGGSFYDPVDDCKSGTRFFVDPNCGSNVVGFRIVFVPVTNNLT